MKWLLWQHPLIAGYWKYSICILLADYSNPLLMNRLVAIVHIKPVIANCDPKLASMAMSLCSYVPASNTWFHGPIRAHNPNGILIGSVVFAGLTSVSPTDW